MIRRLITIGLGGSAAEMILMGFGVTLGEVIQVIRGGRRATKRLVYDLEEKLKISAMLLSANGKELINPIINTVSKTFNDSSIIVKVLPRKLIARKSKDINVSITDVKIRNNDE